MYRLSQ